jgi:hypothetical protein
MSLDQDDVYPDEGGSLEVAKVEICGYSASYYAKQSYMRALASFGSFHIAAQPPSVHPRKVS